MKTCFAVATIIGLFQITLPSAWGFLPPTTEPLPNYDRRFEALPQPTTVASYAASLGPAQDEAAARLRSVAPNVRITRDRLLASPRLITAHYGFLTGPGGRGGAISDAALAAFPANDPQRPIKAFLNEHSALFGHNASALTSARIHRDYVSSHNGLHTIVWEQTLDNIPVFEGMLIGHIARDGELVRISSQFVSDVAQAANRGTPNRAALVGNPTISIERAVSLAAANLGVTVPDSSVTIVENPQGAEKRQTARVPGLFGRVWGQLVWLPMDQSSMRLCWRIILANPRAEQYVVLVDAENGSTPVRHCVTAHLLPATYNVYTSDSPSPFSPGSTTPNGFQPTNTARTMVTLTALSTNASPAGWIPDAGNTTTGNNAFAFRDRNFDEIPDVATPVGVPSRVFDFPLDLTQAPLTYAAASTVQLFYRANWYHDRLYSMGFTEAAGNFQADNFGRGGFGDDPVEGLVQAGADVGFTDNAFFSTPPDGFSGICAMFIFTGPTPDRDGSLDQEVLIHELTHGLSNRLLGGGVGISALQTEGMGEGWSDFFGLCLLSEPSDDVDGVYAAGGYASYRILGEDFTDNYYFGIRRYPYTTDMEKNPLTFKDIDPSRADDHAGIPINPIFGGGDPSEVHSQGEVWCMTLREVWARLVAKSGWGVGNELAMQLVVDGLKLAPANATFLEARDAIIEADLLDTGGDNYVEIWTAFAKRGMGFSANGPTSDTTFGVDEAFDLPPDIGDPDGILEIKVTPPSLEVMIAGQTNVILLRITDVFGVTNATIDATISGGTNLVFRNDGIAPDQRGSNAVYSAFLKVPTNVSSITITMIVSAPGKDTSTNSVTYLVIPPPPNDNFANAIKVPVGGTNYLSNNKDATLENNEPTHAGVFSERASLWWNYTPTVNTNVLVDTGGSSVRTVIGVYTNNSLATLQFVASGAGTSSRPGALVRFNAVAGRTYRIAVAGYDSQNTGTLNLLVAPGAEADTNAPAVTITAPPNGQIVTTNRLLVTGSAVDSMPNATGIRDITIRVIGIPTLRPPITTVISSLTGPLNTNWANIVGLFPGLNSIQVTATDFAGNRSLPTIIQVTYRVLDPPNDFFSAAIALTGNTGTNSVNTLNATKEVGEPNHAGFEGGSSAWWTFSPPADGALTVSTIDSTFDTVMGLYTGPAVNQLVAIASNDDAFEGAPGGYSQIVAPVRTNKTYRIAVDKYQGSGGVVFLSWSFVPEPVFRLTVSNTLGGSVTPSSLDVLSNTPVQLVASPDTYFQFDRWAGSVTSVNNPLTVTVTNDMNLTAHFIPIEFTDGFESGGLTNLNWISSGNKPWIVQSGVVAAGQFAARSGAITHNQHSSLSLTAIFSAGTGSFNYKVSSEPSFDALRFFVDGVQQQQWSGEVGWASFSFPMTAGTHTLEWRYTKDPSLTGGLDSAFIDNVNLPIGVPLNSASAATLQILREGSSYFVDVYGQTNQHYVVQSSTNLVSWQGISTNTLSNGYLRIPISVNSDHTRYYRAVATP